MHIIVKDDESNLRRLKGKGVSEFAKNLESEGWPTEFASEEQRDKVKFLEKKLERPITRKDVRNMGDLP